MRPVAGIRSDNLSDLLHLDLIRADAHGCRLQIEQSAACFRQKLAVQAAVGSRKVPASNQNDKKKERLTHDSNRSEIIQCDVANDVRCAPCILRCVRNEHRTRCVGTAVRSLCIYLAVSHERCSTRLRPVPR